MATKSSFNRLSRKWGEKGRMEENGREEKREPYTEFAAGVESLLLISAILDLSF